MKGLLLKDLYALWSYMRTFLLLDVVMILGGCFTEGNSFLLFYPCILSGMISMTLIAYDEKEKWNEYAMTMPLSKAQMVSCKYILSLGLGLLTVAVICLVRAVCTDTDTPLLETLLTMLPLSILPTAILLPFIYRFGPEKGRMAYYMVLGGFCGIITIAVSRQEVFDNLLSLLQSPIMGIAIPVICFLAYALSWWLSIRFYKKREQ